MVFKIYFRNQLLEFVFQYRVEIPAVSRSQWLDDDAVHRVFTGKIPGDRDLVGLDVDAADAVFW